MQAGMHAHTNSHTHNERESLCVCVRVWEREPACVLMYVSCCDISNPFSFFLSDRPHYQKIQTQSMVAQWYDWHLLVIKMGDTSTNQVSGAFLPCCPQPPPPPQPQAGTGS